MRLIKTTYAAALLMALTLLMAPSALRAATGAEDLKGRILGSFASKSALSNTTSLVGYGTAVNLASGRVGKFSMYALPGGDMRADVLYSSTVDSSVRRSALASYKITDSRFIRAEHEQQWLISFMQKCLALPFELMRKEVEAEHSGMGLTGGSRYEKLTLFDPASPAIILYVDAVTGQPIKAIMDSGYDKDGQFRMEFSRSTEAGRWILPHHFRLIVGGRPTLEITLDRYAFDTALSPQLFGP